MVEPQIGEEDCRFVLLRIKKWFLKFLVNK
jgi:hypothetical protein